MAVEARLVQESAESTVSVSGGEVTLTGELAIPKKASSIVLFAHGSGSSSRSPRNRFVAQALQSRGLATLLFDLLTAEEEAIDRRTARLRFDIGLLTQRLVAATDWVTQNAETQSLRIGYFGASTGAAAALMAAVQRPEVVGAIVSRGGRPDLAGRALAYIRTPTLLIVGGDDEPVILLNREAMAELRNAPKKLVIVPGATHLFEEPGTLDEVARLAGEWFVRYLTKMGNPILRTSTDQAGLYT